MARRIRIGVDTGGTFTDVVAVDERTGQLATTKTPSTPADPAEGFLAGVEKVLHALGLGGDAISAVSHGTTVATNTLLEGKVENLGFITTEGYEHMLEILAREHSAATVSISSQVLREYREYERSVTTLVDAAVKPAIRRYVVRIAERLAAYAGAESGVPFYVMKSNGGRLSADEVVNQPISTVLSGPAAGALGAAVVAERAGFERVLTLDGGGTSTDVTVVVDGAPALTTEGNVGAYPSKIAMIDVVTVGAGGGSIAWTAPEGTLKVGPQSAGAEPGPLR